MATVSQRFPPNFIRSHTATTKSKIGLELSVPTLTTIAPVLSQVHHTSLITLAQDFAHRVSEHSEEYEKLSATLLKHKSLLVPTRLALKRQRTALCAPTLRHETLQSDTYQIELGNSDSMNMQSRLDIQRSTPTPELYRIKSTSNYTGSTRIKSHHGAPTDISLMYREKSPVYHPISGHLIKDYIEGNSSPSPCSYVLPRKPCRERNAPAYTFGTRCFVEKKGGSRTAWQKQWFAHSNPFTTKVDFNRENAWPTPLHYHVQQPLSFQTSKQNISPWSTEVNYQNGIMLATENNPAPDAYDTATAFRKSTAKSIPITFKSRTGGTKISTNNVSDITPGPGAHDNSKFLLNKPSSPKHSFGKRIPSSLCQDPYVNVLPPTRSQK